MSFDPCINWNGCSEKLDKARSYHTTTPLTPEQQRMFIAKAKGQDKEVLAYLQLVKKATPTQVHQQFAGKMLKSSVRRTLNTWTNRGVLRKGEAVPGPYKHVEHEWSYAH